MQDRFLVRLIHPLEENDPPRCSEVDRGDSALR